MSSHEAVDSDYDITDNTHLVVRSSCVSLPTGLWFTVSQWWAARNIGLLRFRPPGKNRVHVIGDVVQAITIPELQAGQVLTDDTLTFVASKPEHALLQRILQHNTPVETNILQATSCDAVAFTNILERCPFAAELEPTLMVFLFRGTLRFDIAHQHYVVTKLPSNDYCTEFIEDDNAVISANYPHVCEHCRRLSEVN